MPVAALQGNLVLDMLDGPNLSRQVGLGLDCSNISVGIPGPAILSADGEIFSIVSNDGHWTGWDLRRSDLAWRCLLVLIHVNGGDSD